MQVYICASCVVCSAECAGCYVCDVASSSDPMCNGPEPLQLCPDQQVHQSSIAASCYNIQITYTCMYIPRTVLPLDIILYKMKQITPPCPGKCQHFKIRSGFTVPHTARYTIMNKQPHKAASPTLVSVRAS